MVGEIHTNALDRQAAKVRVEAVSYWYAGRQSLSDVSLTCRTGR